MIKRSTVETALLIIVSTTVVASCIYLMSRKPEPTHCECKCFDAGYLQACEDFEKYLIHDLEPARIKVTRSREDY